MGSTFWRELNSDLDNRKMKEQSAPAPPLHHPTEIKPSYLLAFLPVQNIFKNKIKSGTTTKYRNEHAATFLLATPICLSFA